MILASFLCSQFPPLVCTSTKMETREIFVITILAIFNVCWGMMASLPVCLLILISNIPYVILIKKTKTMKAPLFPMEASEKGASGSQISPGETNNRFRSFFKKDQTGSSRVSPCEEETECFLLLALGTFRLGSSEIKRESDLFHKGPKRVIKDHRRLSLFSFQYWEFFSSELFPPPSSFRSW